MRNCWYFSVFDQFLFARKKIIFSSYEKIFSFSCLSVAVCALNKSLRLLFARKRTMMDNQLTQIITKPNPIILNGLLHRYFRLFGSSNCEKGENVGERRKKKNQYEWWPRTKQRKSPFIVELVFFLFPMNEICGQIKRMKKSIQFTYGWDESILNQPTWMYLGNNNNDNNNNSKAICGIAFLNFFSIWVTQQN